MLQFENDTLCLFEVAQRHVECEKTTVLNMSFAVLCIFMELPIVCLSLLSSLNRQTTNELPAKRPSPHNFKPNPKMAIRLHKESALGRIVHSQICSLD